MRDLVGRESTETLKGYGFSNSDVEFSRESSEQFRNALPASINVNLDQVQLAYECGVLIGIARGRGLTVPKAIGFRPSFQTRHV